MVGLVSCSSRIESVVHLSSVHVAFNTPRLLQSFSNQIFSFAETKLAYYDVLDCQIAVVVIHQWVTRSRSRNRLLDLLHVQ